jgi:hypothetical protein
MPVIDSHTQGLFRPSRVNIHAASVLGMRPTKTWVRWRMDGEVSQAL